MRTALAVQDVAQNGGAQLVDTTPDQPNGNLFENNGRVRLVIVNGDSGSHSVTITSVTDPYGRTGDLTVAVGAGKTAVLGPFDPLLWNQKSGADQGKVYVDWTASTSMKVTAVRSI